VNPETFYPNLFSTFKKLIFLTVAIILLVLFLNLVRAVVLVFLSAFILTITLNPLVTRLEEKKIPRSLGTFLTLAGIVSFVSLVGWLILPILTVEIGRVTRDLPQYLSLVTERVANLLGADLAILEREEITTLIAQQVLPTIQSVVFQIGQFSITLLNLLIFGAVLFSVLIYSLANPRPLIRTYLQIFPTRLRTKAERALVKGSNTTIGWLWASLIVGLVEGFLAATFLLIIGIPGALIWGVVTAFSELIPRVGPLIMTIPPVLIALAIDPVKALWVLIFYLIMQELAGDLLAPYVRSSQTEINPVLIIFFVVGLTYAFGFLGALIATPVAGFVKAYYEEFYLSGREMPDLETRVEKVLKRQI
jgi:predicted PurR-regulated permease PerM